MSDTGKTVAATGHSLEIVRLIESWDGGRLSELARHLDLSKSTVHCHLNTLREHGYVTKEGEVYHLSLHFFHLGQYARNRDDRYDLAKRITAELAGKLNHAVDFDVEVNGRIMTLVHEADESTEIGLEEGEYLHVHTSATGKAILAELPEERVLEILEQWGMPAETEHTLTDPDELLAEIREVEARGYAIVDQEWLEGLRAVGVAVSRPDGRPLGALSAGGPTYRLTDEAIESEVAPALVDAARELERDIANVV